MRNFIKKDSAILITNPADIYYLTNINFFSGKAILTYKCIYFLIHYLESKNLKSKKNDVKIVVFENFEEDVPKFLKKLKIKVLYFQKDIQYYKYLKYKKIFKDFKFRKSIFDISKLRCKKQEKEISFIRKAAYINDRILEIILKNYLKPKITEYEISQKIKTLALKFGADEMAFHPIVSFSENTSKIHHIPSYKKLKKNDIVLIDIGVKYKGYCSDITRMFFIGKQRASIISNYIKFLEIQSEILKNLKINLKASDLYLKAVNLLKKYSFADYFLHSLGHGVGMEIHELPNISKNSKDMLLENSVFTIEPGAYFGNFGFRVEDLVVLKSKNFEILSKFPKLVII